MTVTVDSSTRYMADRLHQRTSRYKIVEDSDFEELEKFPSLIHRQEKQRQAWLSSD